MSEGGKNNTENRHTHRWRAETRVNKGKNKLVYIWLSAFFGPTIPTFRKAVQNWTLVNTMLSTSTFLFTSSKWGFLSHPGWVFFFFKCRQGIPMGTRLLPITVGSHFLRTCGILPFKWIMSSAILAVSSHLTSVPLQDAGGHVDLSGPIVATTSPPLPHNPWLSALCTALT